MYFLKWILSGALVMASLCPAVQAAEPLKTIPRLDVQRYLGRWYEIAKFPNAFQRQCVADTSALYSLLPDGQIQVLNQCRLVSFHVVPQAGHWVQYERPEGFLKVALRCLAGEGE